MRYYEVSGGGTDLLPRPTTRRHRLLIWYESILRTLHRVVGQPPTLLWLVKKGEAEPFHFSLFSRRASLQYVRLAQDAKLE